MRKTYDRNREEIKCEKCDKEILGTIITALDKPWHIGCFLCFKCKTELRNKNFFLGKDNQTYCEKDYIKLQGTDIFACEWCQDPVVGEILFAFGQAWHPECLKCCGCRKRISGGRFTLIDRHLYCKKDCKKIPKVGKGRFRKGEDFKDKTEAKRTGALKRTGCIVVFKCEVCKSLREKMYVVKRDGKRYCPKCEGASDEPKKDTSLPSIHQQKPKKVTLDEVRKSSNYHKKTCFPNIFQNLV